MNPRDRYDVSHLPEARFEPGSRGRVLQNRLGVKRRREMDEIEAREQLRALQKFVAVYDREHRFTAADIRDLHQEWLGRIYDWAGRYRQVNISKGNFAFAMARQVPSLMENFEKEVLQEFTPCLFATQEEVVHALAVVHTELILIHPFREGNGRVARMLAVLMGLQAGYPALDFSQIKGKIKQGYIAAVQMGMKRDYAAMEDIFRMVLRRTLRQQQK